MFWMFRLHTSFGGLIRTKINSEVKSVYVNSCCYCYHSTCLASLHLGLSLAGCFVCFVVVLWIRWHPLGFVVSVLCIQCFFLRVDWKHLTKAAVESICSFRCTYDIYWVWYLYCVSSWNNYLSLNLVVMLQWVDSTLLHIYCLFFSRWVLCFVLFYFVSELSLRTVCLSLFISSGCSQSPIWHSYFRVLSFSPILCIFSYNI